MHWNSTTRLEQSANHFTRWTPASGYLCVPATIFIPAHNSTFEPRIDVAIATGSGGLVLFEVVFCPPWTMSASAEMTPMSWRGDQHGHGHHLSHSAYDPALSFAYTSVSETRGASTILTSAASLGGPSVSLLTNPSMSFLFKRMKLGFHSN